MKKITLFLDIDGVLCTDSEYAINRRNFWEKHNLAGELKIPYPFNKNCVNIFNKILEKYNIDIVVSSDWRLYFSLDELKKIFDFNNVIQHPLDTTDHIWSFKLEETRAQEIKRYIKEHKIKDYIIIDDMQLSSFLPNKTRFVKTDDKMGLCGTNIKEKIIKLIENDE